MNLRGLAVVASLALAATVTVIVLDTEPRPIGVEAFLVPSRLAMLRDGGKSYVVDVFVDGGVEMRTTNTPGCVRRAVGVASILCRRNAPQQLGGSSVVDPGVLNRFPAGEAVGIGCEPVACAVEFKDDADAKEDDLLDIIRDGGLLGLPLGIKGVEAEVKP